MFQPKCPESKPKLRSAVEIQNARVKEILKKPATSAEQLMLSSEEEEVCNLLD